MYLVLVGPFQISRALVGLQGALSGGKDEAGIFSVLVFGWVGPLVQLAYTRPLSPENLYAIPSTSNTEALLTRFETAWEKQLAKPEGQRRWDMARDGGGGE